MCGRAKLTVPFRTLAAWLRAEPATPSLFEAKPRFNIAPTQLQAVVRQGESGRQLDLLRWGLIPSWAKDKKIGARMINARSEEVESKPSFRAAFKKRRCAVVVDGFYEWKGKAGAKQPYLFHKPDDSPFVLAGLWERWVDKETGEVLETCTVLTTAARYAMTDIHVRMPVVLDEAQLDAWLDPAMQDTAELKALLTSEAAEALVAQPVSKLVNSPANDGPEVLAAPGE